MQDYIPIEIDINGDIGEVAAQQYDNDSRFLHFALTDKDAPDGDTVLNLTGCAARLLVELGEDNYAYIDGEIADGENGIVTFLLPGSVTGTPGRYRAQMRLTDPQESALISGKPFVLRVEESIPADGAIQATPQYSALENALMTTNTLNARMSALEASPAGTGGDVGTEVQAARVSWDGRTFATVGDAVRGADVKLNSVNMNPYGFEKNTYPDIRWHKGHIDSSGALVDSVYDAYRYSDLIHIPAYHMVEFRSKCSTSGAAVAEYDSTGTTVVSVCVGRSHINMLTYYFCSNEDTYIRVCTKDEDCESTYPLVYHPITEKSYQHFLPGTPENDKFLLGYVKRDGDTITADGYTYTKVIHLNKGESIRFKASGTASVWLLSEWEWDSSTGSDGSYVFSGGITAGDRTYHDDVYTADHDMYVRLCSRDEATSFPVPAIEDFKAFEQFYTDSYYADVKNSPLYGKSITFLGDSTAYGNSLGNSVVWLHRLALGYNMTAHNMGLNGSAVVPTGENDTTSMTARYPDIPPSDYIVVIGGSNDYGQNVPIGTNTDTTTETFKGALSSMVDGIRTMYPKAKLLFMTLYSRYAGVNNIGLYEIDYANAMMEICRLKAVPCYDNFSCGIALDRVAAERGSIMTWADEGLSVGASTPSHHLSLEAYNWLYEKYVFALENMTGTGSAGISLITSAEITEVLHG